MNLVVAREVARAVLHNLTLGIELHELLEDTGMALAAKIELVLRAVAQLDTQLW